MDDQGRARNGGFLSLEWAQHLGSYSKDNETSRRTGRIIRRK